LQTGKLDLAGTGLFFGSAVLQKLKPTRMFAEEAVPERDGMTAFACLIDCKTIEKICGS